MNAKEERELFRRKRINHNLMHIQSILQFVDTPQTFVCRKVMGLHLCCLSIFIAITEWTRRKQSERENEETQRNSEGEMEKIQGKNAMRTRHGNKRTKIVTIWPVFFLLYFSVVVWHRIWLLPMLIIKYLTHKL